ncbi:MAG: phosphoribosylformylglycinamidine cyclo-ligase [Spirochaetaceae bacterium]|jgi:phosphoribosylformylglycinamidine cyclo-ligase|nr:phosphoribosylformylglycinamidine cyclo-ligase [Spirochaetaceae bacterium]
MDGNTSRSESYRKAGVDITAGYRAVELIRRHVERTRTAGTLGGLGGFGGLFELDMAETPNPVLVSGTDGVGTKLRVAFLTGRHNTVGIDCVAMCVNDIVCSLAKPLYFLDYIACGKIYPERIAAIVEGIAEGCVQAGCALIGGETAEMPGFYAEDEYDLAGFATGVADKSRLVDPSRVSAGDAIIALASSGVHSNGFSLIRKIFGIDSGGGEAGAERAKKTLADYKVVLKKSLGEELLVPTRIYAKSVLFLARTMEIRGAAHITGGGFYENIPRCLPDGLCARIRRSELKTPAIFSLIATEGGISERDMFNTFNMGVGMILVLDAASAKTAVETLRESGEDAYILGEVVPGERGVEIV